MRTTKLAALLSTLAISALAPSATAQPKPAAPVPDLSGIGSPDEEGTTLNSSLEDLLDLKVQTASRKEERVEEAPNTMYVVTQDQIRRRGYHTLGDLLRTVPGFAVSHGAILNVAQVRGIAPNDNEKLVLMINGHNISNVVEPDWLNGPIDLSIAERVEIIVGPGSVLYGTDTLLGTINIITKTGDASEVNATAGSAMQQGTAILSARKSEDVYLTGTATAMRMTGWDAWHGANHSGNPLAGSTVTGQLDPSYFLTAQGRLGDIRVQVVSLNESFPDLKHAVTTPGVNGKRFERVDAVEISHVHKWGTSGFSTRFVLGYDNKRLSRVFTGTDPTQQGENSYDLSQQTYSGEASVLYESNRHFLQVGVQTKANQNPQDYIYLWAPEDPGYTGPFSQMQRMVKNKDTYQLGFYASESFKVLDQVKLVGAVRVDKSTLMNFGDTYVSPRAAIIYSPRPYWTTKVMYNTATRMPTVWASPLNSVWGQGVASAPAWASVNPLVQRPETLTAVEWQNQFNVAKKTRLAITLYYQFLKDFISWGSPFTNVGDFSGQGSEISFSSMPLPNLSLWGSASYTRAQFTSASKPGLFGAVPMNTSNEMNAVPAVMATAGADLELWQHLDVSAAFRYFTHQPTYDATKSAWGYSDNRFYTDLTITYKDLLIDNFDLSGQVFNLFNNTETVASAFNQARYTERGINGGVQVRYRFQ